MVIVVTAVVGAFFLAMGGYALAAPGATMRSFAIHLTEPRSRYEVRAVYGGFGIAMAVVLAIAALDPGSTRTGIMIAVGAALAGMAAGRLISVLLDDRTSFYPNWFYCLVEAVAATALLIAA
ncbi:DUF4345 family protein [Nocardia sp. NPDC052566]|uniref:DUF4345 family protein n=1 Tax=Nocardia sp. NPDC052566 TaxID=3364330 RepID=UPI0037CC0EC7